MSTDLENITVSFGLVRREFRDVHAIVSRLDTSIAVARGAIPSPRDLLARTLACHALGRHKSRPAAAVAAELYSNGREQSHLFKSCQGRK